MVGYFEIIVYSLLGSVVSMAGGFLLLSRKSLAKNLAAYATPFAAGALLAAVFLDLLPEGLRVAKVETVLMSTLIGLLVFFYLERFLRWFHHHHEHSDAQDFSPKSLVVIGDTIHNALDGIVIASAFLVNAPAGIVATMAVAAHEIPQEIGDFGLLLKMGMSRKKVIMVNLASALSTVVAAVITFWLGGRYNLPLGVMLGISSGLLLYIATSDIIPTIHEESHHKKLFDIKPLLLVFGVIVVALAIAFVKHLGL
jgi:zinc and cadmium transporter